MFPKIVGFPPNGSILIGFSIIFTIHFGVPLFLENTQIDVCNVQMNKMVVSIMNVFKDR